MRYLLLLVLGTVLLSASDNDAAQPVMPDEVTLITGRVLRKVTVVRWEKDRVVLKHAGGADPIPFSMFKSPSPGELPAMRTAWESATAAATAETKAKQKAADLDAKRPTEYSGEMFMGAPGPDSFKLAGMPVFALPPEALKVFATPAASAAKYDLPAPLAQTTTDAAGRFTLTLPANQKFVIFAQSRRRAGGRVDESEWRLPSDQIADPHNIQLSSANRIAGNCQYSFAGK